MSDILTSLKRAETIIRAGRRHPDTLTNICIRSGQAALGGDVSPYDCNQELSPRRSASTVGGELARQGRGQYVVGQLTILPNTTSTDIGEMFNNPRHVVRTQRGRQPKKILGVLVVTEPLSANNLAEEEPHALAVLSVDGLPRDMRRVAKKQRQNHVLVDTSQKEEIFVGDSEGLATYLREWSYRNRVDVFIIGTDRSTRRQGCK